MNCRATRQRISAWLVIPAGVQIKIDDGEPISLQYAVCFLTHCQVQMELMKDMIEKMRKGKRMVVAAMNMQQKAMAFPVQLTDFAKTFDGPPVDNAKYEEARRQMMEKFRQHQMGLRPPFGSWHQYGIRPHLSRSSERSHVLWFCRITSRNDPERTFHSEPAEYAPQHPRRRRRCGRRSCWSRRDRPLGP